MLHSLLEEAGQHRRLITAWLMTAAVAFTWAGCTQAPHSNTDLTNEHIRLHTDRYRAGSSQESHPVGSVYWNSHNQTAVAGVSTWSDGNMASLGGTTWRWVHWSGGADNLSVVDPQNYTLSFDGDGYARIRSDCNQAAGPAHFGEAGTISINLTRMTNMPCTAGSLSDRYLGLLTRVTGWRVANGQLMLDIPRESGLMRFERIG